MSKYGLWLKQKREEADLSQGDVAKIFGFEAQYVSNWERGKGQPSMVYHRKLAKIFKIKESEIDMMSLEDTYERAKAKFERKKR